MEGKTIFVPKHFKPFLTAKFGVVVKSVDRALSCRSKSKTALLIRSEALKMGGFYVED